jgi:hypothetical protein
VSQMLETKCLPHNAGEREPNARNQMLTTHPQASNSSEI